jgi:predicted AAA+ superfamily ATPase
MIKREIFDRVASWLPEQRIILIKGSYGVGKTTLMKQLKRRLEEEGEVTAFFSIDRELENPAFSSPKRLETFIEQQFAIPEGRRLFLFLDEFQYLKDPGLFMKVMFDSLKDKVKFIISGSSSLEIAKTREYLTGRKIEFVLERFNFREFLRGNSQLVYDQRFTLDTPVEEMREFYDIYRQDLEQQFVDFINQGGYPEIVLTPVWERKKEKLDEIIRSYISKDVADFMKIENISGFNNLITLLCDGVGNMVNKTEIANTLGIDFRTLLKYMDILEYTFVFTFTPPFYKNVRKEISKMPKVYCNELGLLTLLRDQRYPDFNLIPGAIIENAAFLHLKEHLNVYYYRTISKAEIDFIVEYKGNYLPLEIKFRKKPVFPTRTFNSFKENYNSDTFIVVSRETLKREDDRLFIPITVLPFVDFDS